MYKILKKIGQGGMGEVFLAIDPVCGRKVALKRVLMDPSDPQKLENRLNRFRNEALIACKLNHPAIIPIYSVHFEEESLFYTMPFVEGMSLKTVLSNALEKEEKGEKIDYLGTVQSLSYVFLEICRAIAYAHSLGALHRDLKPSNIFLGKYGEVQILDWGLATLGTDQESKLKLEGTPSYLAPEIARGNAPTFQSEIYSLGLIFYEMLTLRHPFHRSDMKEYYKTFRKELLVDPSKVSPHRGISPLLSIIACRCVAADPNERYAQVDEIISDLENVLKGNRGWFKWGDLSISDPSAFEAVSYDEDSSAFISKKFFQDEIMLDAQVSLGSTAAGIGFFLNLSDQTLTSHSAGCLRIWLGVDDDHPTQLNRYPAQEILFPGVILGKNQMHHLHVMKMGTTLYVFINRILQGLITDYVPSFGGRIGVFFNEKDVNLHSLSVFLWGKSFKKDPAAAGNALLAHKHYKEAFLEYTRAAENDPMTEDGAKALFHAGVTLFEEMKTLLMEKRKTGKRQRFTKNSASCRERLQPL